MLAHMLDSLVRVSRRVDWNHFVNILSPHCTCDPIPHPLGLALGPHPLPGPTRGPEAVDRMGSKKTALPGAGSSKKRGCHPQSAQACSAGVPGYNSQTGRGVNLPRKTYLPGDPPLPTRETDVDPQPQKVHRRMGQQKKRPPGWDIAGFFFFKEKRKGPKGHLVVEGWGSRPEDPHKAPPSLPPPLPPGKGQGSSLRPTPADFQGQHLTTGFQAFPF